MQASMEKQMAAQEKQLAAQAAQAVALEQQIIEQVRSIHTCIACAVHWYT